MSYVINYLITIFIGVPQNAVVVFIRLSAWKKFSVENHSHLSGSLASNCHRLFSSYSCFVNHRKKYHLPVLTVFSKRNHIFKYWRSTNRVISIERTNVTPPTYRGPHGQTFLPFSEKINTLNHQLVLFMMGNELIRMSKRWFCVFFCICIFDCKLLVLSLTLHAFFCVRVFASTWKKKHE